MEGRFNSRTRVLSKMALISAIFTLIVIGLGAYTRLTNAGLGCPDWPGCYGHLVVPTSQQAIQKIEAAFPSTPLVVKKAWIEMTHRYFAGALGLLILGLALFSAWAAFKEGLRFFILGVVLFATVVYQALLGMWTVTLKLMPVVVTAHLLGGMVLLALLGLLYWTANHQSQQQHAHQYSMSFRVFALMGLVLLVLQISLGAWTSSNYAALSCPDFPFCNTYLNWNFNFQNAFNLSSPVGVSHEGGLLDVTARMTIHTLHRIGALIVSFCLIALAVWARVTARHDKRLQTIVLWMLLCLIAQITLGISNVIFRLPLTIAELHTLGAALLLVSMVAFNHHVFSQRNRIG